MREESKFTILLLGDPNSPGTLAKGRAPAAAHWRRDGSRRLELELRPGDEPELGRARERHRGALVFIRVVGKPRRDDSSHLVRVEMRVDADRKDGCARTLDPERPRRE